MEKITVKYAHLVNGKEIEAERTAFPYQFLNAAELEGFEIDGWVDCPTSGLWTDWDRWVYWDTTLRAIVVDREAVLFAGAAVLDSFQGNHKEWYHSWRTRISLEGNTWVMNRPT